MSLCSGWQLLANISCADTSPCVQGGETLASAMLGGALRSDVRAQGARTSATIQPFTHLQLDIYSRDVYSIADAFTFLTTSEHLERERLAGSDWGFGV